MTTFTRKPTTVTGYRPTPEQLENLKALERFLRVNAKDIKGRFGMEDYLCSLDADTGEWLTSDDGYPQAEIACGSAACAIGWLPSALSMPQAEVDESGTYTDLAEQKLGVHDGYEGVGEYMFSGYWSREEHEDTPEATAKRIQHVIELVEAANR